MAEDIIFSKISLDEPSQLLSIIFDVSSAWYTEFTQYIPPQHQPYTRQILSQLYFDTVGQICIFINTFLTLNKRNLIHFVAVNNERSVVLQQQLSYSVVPPPSTILGAAPSTSGSSSGIPAPQGPVLFPNATWVDPSRLPYPTQASDELFGTTSSDIYSKLILLNPFQFPAPIATPAPSPSSSASPATTRTSSATTRTVASAGDVNTTHTSPSIQSFIRLFTGAFTKSLCFINKAKQSDQSLSPRVVIFSLSPFQGTSGYMSCALFASRIGCLVDTICINHLFSPDEFRETDLLTKLVAKSLGPNAVTSSGSPVDPDTQDILRTVKRPPLGPPTSCHCEPHQQSSHITNGCSLYLPAGDISTLVQLYAETYAASGLGQQQKARRDQQKQQELQKLQANGTSSTQMGDTAADDDLHPESASMESTMFKPQGYLYLLSLLQTHCLSSEQIRQHLITPSQTSVTLSAPCFCHSTTQSSSGPTSGHRYLCNVCLIVVCNPLPQCPNCKSRFVTSRLAVQTTGSRSASVSTSTSTTSPSLTNPPASSAPSPASAVAPRPPSQPPAAVARPGAPAARPLQAAGNKPGKITISLTKR